MRPQSARSRDRASHGRGADDSANLAETGYSTREHPITAPERRDSDVLPRQFEIGVRHLKKPGVPDVLAGRAEELWVHERKNAGESPRKGDLR